MFMWQLLSRELFGSIDTPSDKDHSGVSISDSKFHGRKLILWSLNIACSLWPAQTINFQSRNMGQRTRKNLSITLQIQKCLCDPLL